MDLIATPGLLLDGVIGSLGGRSMLTKVGHGSTGWFIVRYLLVDTVTLESSMNIGKDYKMTPYLGNFLGWILKFFYGVESQAWQLPYRDNQIMGERPMSMHAAFALMAHEMSPMVHVFLVSRLFPRWAIGQTWGRNVFVLAALINQEDLQGALHHEFIHVHQWRREGWWGFGFALEYIWLSIRHGYENNPLEVEARKLSTEN